MTGTETARVAVLWRGDRDARRNATSEKNRFYRIFEELSALGIHVEPAVYADEMADEVREQLLKVDGVLVWVDPIHDGQTRLVLDAVLREVALRGPWVSAHPDVILKMGVKEAPGRPARAYWFACCMRAGGASRKRWRLAISWRAARRTSRPAAA